MFNLFKDKKKITKLHRELSPSERIKKVFEEQLEPFLVKHDFKFIKSKNLFKRKVGRFTQEIYIAKSKWNHADEICFFWLIFSVFANDYNDWHKKQYGILPVNNCVTSSYHNQFKNWRTKYKLDKYDLSKQDNNNVLSEIKSNISKLVLPFFDQYSDYKKAADTLMRNKEYWWAANIFDYYLIAGEPDKANEALKHGKEYLEKQVNPQKEFLEAMNLRL